MCQVPAISFHTGSLFKLSQWPQDPGIVILISQMQKPRFKEMLLLA